MVNWTVVAICIVVYVFAGYVGGIGMAGAIILATILSLIYA